MVTKVVAIGESLNDLLIKTPYVEGDSDWKPITIRTSAATGSFRQIKWNGSIFLLISDGGLVYKNLSTSDDWNLVSSDLPTGEPTGLDYNSSNSTWVCVYKGGKIFYSLDDGSSWTNTIAGVPVNTKLHALSVDTTTFITVGDHGTMLTSIDGITWVTIIINPTPSTLNTPVDTPYFGIKYANGRWVLVGLQYIITSTDAFTTYEKVTPLANDTYSTYGVVKYGTQDFWLITGDQYVRYSFDNGLTWDKSNLKFVSSKGAAFDGFRWYIVDVSGRSNGGSVLQNSILTEVFSYPDDASELPQLQQLSLPYINGGNNVTLDVEYPISNWEPFRAFPLVKDQHWEEVGTAGQLSSEIRLLASPSIIVTPISIALINQTTRTITVLGDYSVYFTSGFKFKILNSVANDGIYTTLKSVISEQSPGAFTTAITVLEVLSSNNTTGTIQDDNQLINKHVYTRITSLFDWEPSTSSSFPLYYIETNFS